MRLILFTFFLSIIQFDSLFPQGNPPLEITYIANTGFMIKCEEKKVLVDALFGGFQRSWCYVPSDSIIELMKSARAPFDDVDIIAVTHAHIDHFTPEIVSSHLHNNPDGILVCTQQTKEQLTSTTYLEDIQDRIRVVSGAVDSTVSLFVDGINLQAIPSKHDPFYEEDTLTGKTIDRHQDVQHLEFILIMCGYTLYHSGDVAMNDVERYRSLGFGEKTIDVAFVTWWDAREQISFRQKLIRDEISPKRVILMHLFPNRLPKGHPEKQNLVAEEVILPANPMQQWIFH